MLIWQQTARLSFSAALFFCLLHLSYTDLTQRRLPNRWVAAVAALGLANCLVAGLVVAGVGAGLGMGADAGARVAAGVGLGAGLTSMVLEAARGALLAAGPAAAVAGAYRLLRGRSGLGAGDVKLLAALGLCFGARAFWILPVACLVCVLSLPFIALWRRGLRTLPFGPYIAIGAVTLLVTAPTFLSTLTG